MNQGLLWAFFSKMLEKMTNTGQNSKFLNPLAFRERSRKKKVKKPLGKIIKGS